MEAVHYDGAAAGAGIIDFVNLKDFHRQKVYCKNGPRFKSDSSESITVTVASVCFVPKLADTVAFPWRAALTANVEVSLPVRTKTATGAVTTLPSLLSTAM